MTKTTNPLTDHEITACFNESRSSGHKVERCAVEILCKNMDDMWTIQNFLVGVRDAKA